MTSRFILLEEYRAVGGQIRGVERRCKECLITLLDPKYYYYHMIEELYNCIIISIIRDNDNLHGILIRLKAFKELLRVIMVGRVTTEEVQVTLL